MNETLAIAFDVAAGLRTEPAPDVPESLVAFARRVVSVGRRVAAAPACPSALISRAVAIADEQPLAAHRALPLLRLLFDSWAGVLPVFRGPGRSRFLRYGGPQGGLDLELVAEPEGGVRVRGTVERPEGPTRGLAVVLAGHRGRPTRAAVRAGGTFSATVPAGSAPFSIAVRSGRRTLLATGRIPPPVRG